MSTKRKTPDTTGRKRQRAALTVAKVKAALIANHGIQARAAEQLGVLRPLICDWVKRYPELRKVIDDMIPDVVDMAKDNIVGLMESADDGVKLRASSKVIDTYGARFGLGARQHFHSAPDGGAIQFDMSVFTDEQLERLEELQSTLAAAARANPR